jgi:hypothetical protein
MDSKAKAVIAQFEKAAEKLNSALRDAKKVWPGAEYYLACSTLNLMSGPHHEGKNADGRPDRILASVRLEYADGGDW